ncbi:MAG: glycine zipper domain-containing protein [Bacteroidota bacterium]
MKSMSTIKNVMGVIAITGVLFACKGNKTNALTDETRVLSAADSAQMKEFEKWKERKEQPEKKTVVVYKDREVVKENTATSVPAETKKKGWSKAAKGAVIGGVTGAAAGAVINKKNRAAGAVIGGAVGAGVGYGIGRAKDKKDGRY